MSSYTTELRYICEDYAGLAKSADYNSIDSILEASREKLFDFDFPIFDETYRAPLEKKIMRHYYRREIGFETAGLFKHYLCVKMTEIMPYYNQLYKSQLYDFNPFYDIDLTRDHAGKAGSTTDGKEEGSNSRTADTKKESTGTKSGSNNDTTDFTANNGTGNRTLENQESSTTSNGTASSSKTNKFSDTPQGRLDEITANTYLTNVTIDEDSGSTKQTGNGTTKIDRTSTGAENKKETTEKNGKFSENDKDNETSNTTEKGNSSKTTKEVFANTEEYIEHVKGKQGSASYSSLLEEFRRTFLNIDAQLIEELNDLFMLLW